MSFVRWKWLGIPAAAAIMGVAVGAGSSELVRQYFVEGPSAAQLFVFPGGDLRNDADVARLDTRSGAVYRYRGELGNPNVKGTWELRVPAPRESNSGMLEIQRLVFPSDSDQPQVATFLVDVATGKTWVLHLRANSNGTWDLIDDFKHNDWGLN